MLTKKTLLVQVTAHSAPACLYPKATHGGRVTALSGTDCPNQPHRTLLQGLSPGDPLDSAT